MAIKGISKDFYRIYGKSFLREHIEQLLNEYRNYPDPDLDIDANYYLEWLDDYVERW